MPLNKFLAAVAGAAQKYAAQYGLDAKELQLAMITAAGLEGGLGEEAAVGDGGQSFGRFQYYLGGGHGTTVLNNLMAQGYSHSDAMQTLADDEFQAYDFAPEIAKNLAAAKQAGLSGGDAVRQAIFAAERPAEMYSAERFNNSIASAASLMGGAPPASVSQSVQNQGAGGGDVPAIRAALQKRVRDSLDKYNSSGNQQDYIDLQKALFDLGSFEDAVPADSSKDPAQQAFDNAIKLGDMNLKVADSAYQRWSDKNTLARAAAQLQVQDADSKNKTNADIASTYFERNGQGPKPLTTTYLAPTFDQALENWQKKFGATPADYPANMTGASLPSLPATAPATSAPTNAATPAEAPVISPSSGSDRARFLDLDYSRDKPVNQKTTFGDFLGAGAKLAGEGLISAVNPAAGMGIAITRTAKTGKKWWQKLGSASTYKFGIPGYASGTMNHGGGPAILNENGPETAIIPGFNGPVQFQGGPQMQNLPPGTAIVPSNVPPDEALAYSQIRNALNQPAQGDPTDSLEAQAQRANDPQLQQKVIESLRNALAAQTAAKPPMTPILTGQWNKDPWADLRQLTGVPANGDPAAAGGA